MQAGKVARLLEILLDHEVEFIVVGGTAAVLQGAPVMTLDVDIVHSRAPANVGRLLNALEALNARYRSRPELKPTADHLSSAGRQLLATTCGPLDVLGAIEGGRDYDNLLPDTDVLKVRGRAVRVLTGGILLQLKEQSSDPADQSRAAVLRRAFRPNHS
jgi:hypothetical protein